MVLALVVGDLHFKKDTPVITDLVIHKILEQVIKIKPDVVILLGDILDTHEKIDMKTLNRTVKFIKHIAGLDIPVIITVGNHERPDGTTFLTEDSSFYALKGFSNIHIADRVLDLKWDIKGNKEKIRFIFVPYVQAGSFHEALDTLEVKVMDPDHRPAAIFCHQEFKGVKIGGYTSKSGDEWPETNPLIISGHIHRYQQPQSNIVYPGTPYQQSYSDDSNKGILVCEFLLGKTPSISFLSLDIRKKKSIKLKPAEVDSFVPPPNCDLQVDIVGTSDEIKVLSSKGVINKMRSKGINVSLSTQQDFNPKNPDNKPYKDLLLDLIKGDTDAESLFNEIFAPVPSTTLQISPNTNLSELIQSAQEVTATKIAPDSNHLLNSLLAQARTAGSFLNITPVNVTAVTNATSSGPTTTPEQSNMQSLFAGFPLAQTERAPLQPAINPEPPAQTMPPPVQPSTAPFASFNQTPNHLLSSQEKPKEPEITQTDLMSSLLSSANAEKNKPSGGLLAALMQDATPK